MVQRTDRDNRSINRRSYLSAIAGVAAAPVVGSAVGAADVDDESQLEAEIESGGTVNLDSDTIYEIDDTIRVTGLDDLTLDGNGATVKIGPTTGYVFKLGISSNPINNLTVKNFNIDLSTDGAGGRIFECHAADNLEVSDITVEGEHDTAGKGPMLVGLHTSDGSGTVSNVDLPDGGEDSSSGYGGTGMFVSHYHTGEVTIRDCHIGPFPDNGLYCSNASGDVHVEGGHFENCNVAGVRLDGDNCSLKGATFEYDEDIPGFDGQRPVRCDGGDIEISDIHVDMSINQTEAIRVMSGAESVSIKDCSMDLHGEVRDAVSVTTGAGSVTTSGNDFDGYERQPVYHY
ncbi:hypothetical protein ACFQKF_19175 [Halalkalicoccus sp. GCM10025322]|uniref:hypothetical protein n=1 Tax=Halalkalicoccus TaxID=332246 RepID=UPI002F962721